MKLFFKAAALSIALLFASGASAADAGHMAKINDVYVIHLILDGTNLDAFDKAMAEGRMPTIKKRFVDNGASFSLATSVFPSTSTCAYQAFTTGLLPGHAGIPHLERFDREHEKVVGYLTTSGFKMLNTDLINLRALTNPDVVQIEPPTTMFELLQGYPTAAIYSSFSRGASERHPKIAPIAALWSTYVTDRQENVDVLALKRVKALFEKRPSRIPRYTLVGLYSSDIMGHKHGPQSPEVADVLHQFDLFMREFLALLEKQGIVDKTYIIVSADHGMHDTGKLFYFQEELEKAGIHVKPHSPKDRDYTLYAANRGVISSHIYVRHDGGFAPIDDPEILRKFPTNDGGSIDLIDFIKRLEATELVVVRAGERRARIFDRDGAWADVACYTIEQRDYCSYQTKGGDPLGYRANHAPAKLLDGQPHSIFAWRDATAGMPYPDAVVELSQIFHDGRSGDIFITTRGHYGFRKVKAGNHGGADAGDMRVPLLIAGPTVSPGAYGTARPVDLYPMVLGWFGISVPPANYDGMDPFVKFGGDDPDSQRLALLEQMFDGNTPHVNRAEFGRLKTLALQEAARRKELVQKLEALLGRLDAQKNSKDAPEVAPPGYLDDHIAIVQRTLAWAKGGLDRMEDIESTLSGKSSK
ncbi:MAG: alkaline phosphatase family protein [bacterium]